MTFIDTNVVLRWLLQDHRPQSRQVNGLIDHAPEDSFLVSDVVLAETYYVLARAKDYSNPQIAEILRTLTEWPAFAFEDERLLGKLFAVICETTLDFADCYLISRAIHAGEPLKTFDKQMQKAYARHKRLSARDA